MTDRRTGASHNARKGRFWVAGLLALGLIGGGASQADTPPAASTPVGKVAAADNNALGWSSVSPPLGRQLDTDQKSVRDIFQRLNGADPAMGDIALADLTKQVSAIQQDTHAVIGQIQSYDTIISSFLQVLGDKPAANEDASITAQRQRMQKDSQSVKSMLVRARLYELQAKQLGTVIDGRRSRIQQATLSRRTSSPIAPHFWHALVTEKAENQSSVENNGVLADWPYLLGGTFLVLILTGLTAYPLLAGLRRLGAKPEALPASTDNNEIPRASGVVAITAGGMLCAILAPVLWLLWEMITMGGDGGPIAATISDTMPVCGFILGAGLPILGRAGLLANNDIKARHALRGVDWMLACGVLALDLLHAFQSLKVFGPTLTVLLEIVFALAVSISTVSTCRRLGRQAETRLLAPSVLGLATLLTFVTVIAIVLGYVSFAFSLNGWLLVLGTGIAIVGLLGMCWREAIERLLGARGFFGSRLVPLGVGPRRLSQLTVVLSGIGNVMLLLILVSIVQSEGDFNLATIFGRLGLLFSGSNIRGIPISLDTVLICIGLFIAAYYAIRQTRNWMRDRLFPTTTMDIGSQTSILSVFTYCSWIIVGLTVLSVAGVSIKNLTWVVSALSVGIGFGLQSIVQNFVSGIILLAERPVRVGDVVEIAGTRGDVKRISVRATNIGLSDGSTMIVPNSQFITTNVKNATLGSTGAALTLSFTVPITADLDQARAMLLEVAAKRPEVLSTPTPKVRVTAIGSAAVTMTLGINLISVRESGSVQDAILFDVFRRFHAEDIAIATT